MKKIIKVSISLDLEKLSEHQKGLPDENDETWVSEDGCVTIHKEKMAISVTKENVAISKNCPYPFTEEEIAKAFNDTLLS